MSAALTLATPAHAERLLPLVEKFHAEAGIESTADTRSAGVLPLLEGVPHGVAYLIGPPRAPVGYIIICFGWSVEFGGMDGFVDELFIRTTVRGRGIATEVLLSLPRALADAGLKALHLEVSRSDEKTQALYHRTGFRVRDGYNLMSRVLG